jgi:hypothetical protein
VLPPFIPNDSPVVCLQLAYFKVLGSIGAVAAGILNGLRAVGVFIASGMFFCNLQETQCLTIGRYTCSAAFCGFFPSSDSRGVWLAGCCAVVS